MKRSNFMSYLLLLATNYQFIVGIEAMDRVGWKKKWMKFLWKTFFLFLFIVVESI